MSDTVRYDGVRAQVHLMADGALRFFSRSSKDSSSELPDLIPVMEVKHNRYYYVILNGDICLFRNDDGLVLSPPPSCRNMIKMY